MLGTFFFPLRYSLILDPLCVFVLGYKSVLGPRQVLSGSDSEKGVEGVKISRRKGLCG